MSHDRMRRKYIGYWEYLTSGAYTKKHGFRSFRVMTVTLTEERAENLTELARESLPETAEPYVLFSSIGSMSAQTLNVLSRGEESWPAFNAET